MSRIIAGLYREPVLFAGFVVAVTAALSVAGVIPAWIAPVVAAGGAVVTRRYTRPDKTAGSKFPRTRIGIDE